MYNFFVVSIFLLITACAPLKPSLLNLDNVNHIKLLKQGSLISSIEEEDQKWILNLMKDCIWTETLDNPETPETLFQFYKKDKFITVVGVIKSNFYTGSDKKMWKCMLNENMVKKLSEFDN